jgi:hypothetical protein
VNVGKVNVGIRVRIQATPGQRMRRVDGARISVGSALFADTLIAAKAGDYYSILDQPMTRACVLDIETTDDAAVEWLAGLVGRSVDVRIDMRTSGFIESATTKMLVERASVRLAQSSAATLCSIGHVAWNLRETKRSASAAPLFAPGALQITLD